MNTALKFFVAVKLSELSFPVWKAQSEMAPELSFLTVLNQHDFDQIVDSRENSLRDVIVL